MNYFKLKVSSITTQAKYSRKIKASTSYYFVNEYDMYEFANMLRKKRNWRINSAPVTNKYSTIYYQYEHNPEEIKNRPIRNEFIVESEMPDKLKCGDVVYDCYLRDYVRIFSISEESGRICAIAETADDTMVEIRNHPICLFKPKSHED